MITDILAIATGGAFGALCRYFMVMTAENVWGIGFPYGTLFVNCTGSLFAGSLLAFLVGRFSGTEYVRLLLLTGFLGAYTTFSSFAAETLFLFEQGQWLKLSFNIILNNAGALFFVWIGWTMTKLLLTNG